MSPTTYRRITPLWVLRRHVLGQMMGSIEEGGYGTTNRSRKPLVAADLVAHSIVVEGRGFPSTPGPRRRARVQERVSRQSGPYAAAFPVDGDDHCTGDRRSSSVRCRDGLAGSSSATSTRFVLAAFRMPGRRAEILAASLRP